MSEKKPPTKAEAAKLIHDKTGVYDSHAESIADNLEELGIQFSPDKIPARRGDLLTANTERVDAMVIRIPGHTGRPWQWRNGKWFTGSDSRTNEDILRTQLGYRIIDVPGQTETPVSTVLSDAWDKVANHPAFGGLDSSGYTNLADLMYKQITCLAALSKLEPSKTFADRVQAWERIVKHAAFRPCFGQEVPLIESMCERLTSLVDTEQTVTELMPEPKMVAERVPSGDICIDGQIWGNPGMPTVSYRKLAAQYAAIADLLDREAAAE